MHRNRVLRPQHSVKVWWLDVGRCWPLKSAIGFDFWGRPGFFSFPKYVFHFPGVFISWALWVLTAKPACFWTACLACSVTCFTGPQGTPPPSFLASKTVLLLSPPLSLSLWISTSPHFSVTVFWLQEELEVNGYVQLLWLPRNFWIWVSFCLQLMVSWCYQ